MNKDKKICWHKPSGRVETLTCWWRKREHEEITTVSRIHPLWWWSERHAAPRSSACTMWLSLMCVNCVCVCGWDWPWCRDTAHLTSWLLIGAARSPTLQLWGCDFIRHKIYSQPSVIYDLIWAERSAASNIICSRQEVNYCVLDFCFKGTVHPKMKCVLARMRWYDTHHNIEMYCNTLGKLIYCDFLNLILGKPLWYKEQTTVCMISN